MSLPNKLTISRIILTLFFVVFITREGFVAKFFGSFLFYVASFTDFYDGYYARKYNAITNFGKLMDPIADKFLMLMAFLIFVNMQIISIWYFIVIFFREVIVTLFRLYAKSSREVLAAEKLGKIKTCSQALAAYVILIYITMRETVGAADWTDYTFARWQTCIDVLMIIAVLLTLLSGASFIWNNRKIWYAE